MKCTLKIGKKWKLGESFTEYTERYTEREDVYCDEEMVEVGELLKIGLNQNTYRDEHEIVTLYQCPSCKTIKLV